MLVPVGIRLIVIVSRAIPCISSNKINAALNMGDGQFKLQISVLIYT